MNEARDISKHALKVYLSAETKEASITHSNDKSRYSGGASANIYQFFYKVRVYSQKKFKIK